MLEHQAGDIISLLAVEILYLLKGNAPQRHQAPDISLERKLFLQEDLAIGDLLRGRFILWRHTPTNCSDKNITQQQPIVTRR